MTTQHPAETQAHIRDAYGLLSSWPHRRQRAAAPDPAVVASALRSDSLAGAYRAPPTDSLLEALCRASEWGEVVLVLIARGEADAARRTWTALDDARSDSDEQALYLLTGELVAVHAGVPLEVRAAIARAIRAGDVMSARDALVSFAERHGVAARDRVRRILDAHAAAIAAAVGDFVWREPPPASFRPPLSFVLLLIVGAFTGIGEPLSGPQLDEEPAAPTIQEQLREIRPQRSDDDAHGVLAPIAAELRDDAAASFCERADAERCRIARTWARALHDGDCAGAALALALLLSDDTTTPIDDETACNFRRAQRMACPDVEDPAAP
ncbi:hypothetical protein [Sandaracinus amylolyticus]|uniref:Uncharacterized protein n=1 Tax=Sandaracinus amylolyticus TaxID=927083 RepID=A0A0F6YGT5_9BACT|nr:hypothetical protein [Sandaracinus amylolyticus]AKF04295.1 hypothetical protein DB32_001444 [Sandaracinus amylolyticus]